MGRRQQSQRRNAPQQRKQRSCCSRLISIGSALLAEEATKRFFCCQVAVHWSNIQLNLLLVFSLPAQCRAAMTDAPVWGAPHTFTANLWLSPFLSFFFAASSVFRCHEAHSGTLLL